MHRQHRDITSDHDWITVGDWLGLDLRRLRRIDAWNAIAAVTGQPAKVGTDTVTAEEWNQAVNIALARHA